MQLSCILFYILNLMFVSLICSFYMKFDMGILRKTKSVKIVLNEFTVNSSATSVIALIERLKSEMNKTTVYRILEKLEDDGILHSFLAKDGLKWYAKCRGCSSTTHHDVHPHFQCLECGKVDCLKMNFIIPEIANRKVEVSQILLQGKCEECYLIVS